MFLKLTNGAGFFSGCVLFRAVSLVITSPPASWWGTSLAQATWLGSMAWAGTAAILGNSTFKLSKSAIKATCQNILAGSIDLNGKDQCVEALKIGGIH